MTGALILIVPSHKPRASSPPRVDRHTFSFVEDQPHRLLGYVHDHEAFFWRWKHQPFDCARPWSLSCKFATELIAVCVAERAPLS